MSKALRLSEKWFQRGLWLVALVFAGFLIGLGGTVVGDLPHVENSLQMENFLQQPQAAEAQSVLKTAALNGRTAEEALEQAQLKLQVAQANSRSGSETFSNWLATRRATERADQDPELLDRTRALDTLKATERQALAVMEAQQQQSLDASQAAGRARGQFETLEQAARDKLHAAQRTQELRVFLYRLALTLPLLVAAGWLLAKKRKSTYWPFVWGFVFFALFAFFVELVPYLPSYGGYVRYVVGIVVTVLVGRQAIQSLNRYLETQKLTEQLPDVQRREELSYDTALTRLSKQVCPGCERGVDLKNPEIDFCSHCGICLFDHCVACSTRKSGFAKFCHACGANDNSGSKVRPETAHAASA